MKKKTAPAGLLILLLAILFFSRGEQHPAATTSPPSQPGTTINFDAPINLNPGPQTSGNNAEAGRVRIDPHNIPPQSPPAEQREREKKREKTSGPRMLGDYRVAGVRIVDNRSGRVMPIDEVDLKPALERIRRGERDTHRNDGTVYRNLNRKLPQQPNGYYHEYVVPTEGMGGPGPQRLVIGKNGEVYYTWDHYDNFLVVEGGK